MKKNILKYFIYLIIIIISFLYSCFLLDKFNTSVISAYKIIFFIFLIILFIGILISKLIFRFKKDKKLQILNLSNCSKKELYKCISNSLIILLIYFSIVYIMIYFFSNNIFSKLNYSTGIINSCSYISKIFLLSLPIATFEITFLEYCNFLKTIRIPLTLTLLKFVFWCLISYILTNIIGINGFLYSKPSIDIFFFPYYITKIREIIKLIK